MTACGMSANSRDYRNATVLLSDDYRYFGTAPDARLVDQSRYPQLGNMLCTAMRPYRRGDHNPALLAEVRALWRAAQSTGRSAREPV